MEVMCAEVVIRGDCVTGRCYGGDTGKSVH